MLHKSNNHPSVSRKCTKETHFVLLLYQILYKKNYNSNCLYAEDGETGHPIRFVAQTLFNFFILFFLLTRQPSLSFGRGRSHLGKKKKKRKKNCRIGFFCVKIESSGISL